MSNDDLNKLTAELELARQNLKEAERRWRKELHSQLIEPLDIESIVKAYNSELMQMKEQYDNSHALKGFKSRDLMEQLWKHIATIEWFDENGEEKNFRLDINYKVCEVFLMNHHFSIFQILMLNEMAAKEFASQSARAKAYKKLENCPKQKALEEIEGEFIQVKDQFKRYGFTAQFVRQMAAQYPVIESYKTIENLVSELKKYYLTS